VFVPLIDFERTTAPAELADLPRRLVAASGGRELPWLVVTSITTVRAFADAGIIGELLDARDRYVLAAVGTASAAALEDAGFTVDRTPGGQRGMNAAGLVELCRHETRTTAFLPQANIAAPTLAQGLLQHGWGVVVVEAYRTVDAPAHPERRLSADLPGRQATAESAAEEFGTLTPAEAVLRTWRAVVGMSPSSVRRLHEVFGGGVPPLVAIGPSTRAEAETLGIDVAGEAEEPTPAAVVAVLRSLTAP
jgi:uroporphyrinogen-III synthase